MSFQQPASSIIKQYHFRGKTYTFPVEATMPSESDGGQLRMTVSDGYVLKTSSNELPQNQHTLDYVKQSDGSWLVRNTVTLMATAPSLISGTVILHDPMGATLRLVITIEPALFIDESPIIFDKTRPGKSNAALLTIRQQGAVTPVNLQVSPARAFTVANAKMAFVTMNGLSITPSFEGANVIINYTPIQAGHHNAHLVINTPYDTKTIPLMGQTGGMLGWLPKLSIVTPSTQTSPLFTLPTLRQGHLIGALTFLVLLGLIWGSYTFLSQSKSTVDLAVLTKQPAKTTHQVVSLVNHEPKQTEHIHQNGPPISHEHEGEMAQRQQVKPLPLPVESVREETPSKQTDQLASDEIARTTVSQASKKKLPDYIKSTPVVFTKTKLTKQAKLSLTEQTRTEHMTQAKVPVTSADDVSDLEQELNNTVSRRARP